MEAAVAVGGRNDALKCTGATNGGNTALVVFEVSPGKVFNRARQPKGTPITFCCAHGDAVHHVAALSRRRRRRRATHSSTSTWTTPALCAGPEAWSASTDIVHVPRMEMEAARLFEGTRVSEHDGTGRTERPAPLVKIRNMR